MPQFEIRLYANTPAGATRYAVDWDSRTELKRIEDWLRKHGWWLFSVGTVLNFLLLICVLGTVGRHDPNVLSVSITILEVFIVIVAVAGFWLIRGAAVTAARAGAREEVKRLYDDGYLTDGHKRAMFAAAPDPVQPPDLSQAVREIGDDVVEERGEK